MAIVAVAVTGWVAHRAPITPGQYPLLFGLIAAVMLIVAPSAHARYYVFLLPALTAILGNLVRVRLSGRTIGFWAGLCVGYTFIGFDQPFFVTQRLFGFGIVVLEHWLAWHLPTLGLLLTITILCVLLLERSPDPPAAPDSPSPLSRGRSQAMAVTR